MEVSATDVFLCFLIVAIDFASDCRGWLVIAVLARLSQLERVARYAAYSGVDIPNDKPTYISLQYLYGVGDFRAFEICFKLEIDPQRKARELSDDELARISQCLIRITSWKGP